MSLDFTAIDDQLIDRLTSQVTSLRSVETLDSEDQLFEPGVTPPVAYTFIPGAKYAREQGNSGHQEGDLFVSVFIKTRNVRGNGAARKDQDGAYELIEAIVTALLGFAPTPCGPLEIDSIDPVEVTKHAAIYEIKFIAPTSEDF